MAHGETYVMRQDVPALEPYICDMVKRCAHIGYEVNITYLYM